MKITLFKRAANGEPQEWWISMSDKGDTGIGIGYGKVGGTCHTEVINVTMTDCAKEFQSRVNEKKKAGYKELSEIYDNAPDNIDNLSSLYNYLNVHLPKYNASNNGNILPMLAKTLENNKPFEKYGAFRGQWKINGLRCEVGAIKNDSDLFHPLHLTFQSREGTTWNLPYLEEMLLEILPPEIIDCMLDSGAKLDGEIYLPGYKVNEINHFAKNPNAPQHKLLQYWLYDFAIENMSYEIRRQLLEDYFKPASFNKTEDHLNNKKTLIFLPETVVFDHTSAIVCRDNFIDLGFEGLILRNPAMEYGFGKRAVGLMYKFKKIEDGLFTIIDIVPEGKKRTDLCKLILRNDINDEVFECTLNASHKEQSEILANREDWIGHDAKVEFRERSGVNQVPFHAKCVEIQ